MGRSTLHYQQNSSNNLRSSPLKIIRIPNLPSITQCPWVYFSNLLNFIKSSRSFVISISHIIFNPQERLCQLIVPIKAFLLSFSKYLYWVNLISLALCRSLPITPSELTYGQLMLTPGLLSWPSFLLIYLITYLALWSGHSLPWPSDHSNPSTLFGDLVFLFPQDP